MANSVVPNIARKKLIEARAGIRVLPVITGFCFGDGGVNEDGTTKIPDVTMTALNHEIARKVYSSRIEISDVLMRYHCDIEEGEMGGKKISEIGLYDSEGDLIMVQFFQPHADDLQRGYDIDDDYT